LLVDDGRAVFVEDADTRAVGVATALRREAVGAPTNQKVAVTGLLPAWRPNNRHMVHLLG